VRSCKESAPLETTWKRNWRGIVTFFSNSSTSISPQESLALMLMMGFATVNGGDVNITWAEGLSDWNFRT
jgi:hypothetical protein